MFVAHVGEKLAGFGRAIAMVWALSLLMSYTLDWLDVKRLERYSFDDFVVYYAVTPIPKTPKPLSEIRFSSDMEVTGLVLEHPFRIKWFEHIACDNYPLDDNEYFEYYKSAETTARNYTKPKARPDPSRERKGFPVNNGTTTLPLQYPYHEADCQLVTVAVQYHEHDVIKTKYMVSDVANVREAK